MGEVDILIIVSHWDGIDVGAVFDSNSFSAHVQATGMCGNMRWSALPAGWRP
jgi:hypothetical protein